MGLDICLGRLPDILSPPQRVGMLVHECSLTSDCRYAHVALMAALPSGVAALFGPQHGVWATEQENMVETPHGVEPHFGLPVHSLYSETRTPTAAMLDAIDVLVVDLQDVGTRVYTYVWTLRHCMAACAGRGIPVVVLDRPNPLGGLIAEGPLLTEGFHSFVGEAAIPMRHGLTLGELARLLNSEQALGCDLHVVPMVGWHRQMQWPQTGRPWHPPSPNLPRWSGAAVYPGQVLLEGTNLSEGRGTTTPFEVFGAPWVDPLQLLDALDPGDFGGLHLRPTAFVPTFHKYAGQRCGGLFLHVDTVDAVRSYTSTVALLAAVRRLWPDRFDWRPPPYEYEADQVPIDILSGSAILRQVVDGGGDWRSAVEWDEPNWWRRAAPHLIYS